MKKIAVLTSGGDAPGMNAAIKGIVRSACNRGWEVFGVRDGYKGLVEGGDLIFPLNWDDVERFSREGGTFLGSARFTRLKGDSPEALESKKNALLNLLGLGVTGLVVIGGDGSLRGAQALYSYLKNGETCIPEMKDMCLSIVGIPGSIDNDVALTDMSLGTDTTLNTIVECIDKLRDTAASHKRVIIVEVMGRLRGYLAIMSGLATGADKVLIREESVSMDELHTMLHDLEASFDQGQKAGIIVRSEGALFSTRFIKETIDVLLKADREVRETVLGHLQRGGTPTCFERVLGLRMGMNAVQTLRKDPSEPRLIVLRDNTTKAEPLDTALDKMDSPLFRDNLSVNAKHAFSLGSRLENPPREASQEKRIAILTEGENISGMNMAIRAVSRLAINQGIEVIGIKGGFQGLVKGLPSVLDIEWGMLEMKGILLKAGTLLGVSSKWITKEDLSDIKDDISKLRIDGLITIGNERAFQLSRKTAPMLALPIVGIPATLNCDIHGTDWSIGMDSASNDLMKSIDRLVDTAHVKKKICVIHVKGDNCTCLVKQVALAGGVDQWIIQEGPDTYSDEALKELIREKVQKLKRFLDMGKNFATMIFSSNGHKNSKKTLKVIEQAMRDVGIDLDITVVPLETDQGGVIPAAFDRVIAGRLGEKAFSRLMEKIEIKDGSFDMVGIRGKEIHAAPYHGSEESEDSVCFCPPSFEFELQDCLEQIFQPRDGCVGLGGTIQWSETSKRDLWEGIWICKKCSTRREIFFDSKQTLSISCVNESCSNFGYIRTSRRF